MSRPITPITPSQTRLTTIARPSKTGAGQLYARAVRVRRPTAHTPSNPRLKSAVVGSGIASKVPRYIYDFTEEADTSMEVPFLT